MFTIPDKGEGLNDIQSILFQEYIDVLVAGVSGVDCVLSGCAVTAQAAPDMTVAVAAGSVRSNAITYTVTAGNGTITAADVTNPRLDLVVITSAGAIAVRAGTASSTPKPAARVANDVVLAVVFVPAGDTAIESNQIVDLRTVSGIPAGAFSHRNKIINGKMEIAQRGTSFTDPNDVYTLDRWKVNVDNIAGAALSVAQNTAAQDAINYGNLLRYSVTTVGSMTFADIRQLIEDVRTLQGKQVTVSFLLRYGAVGKTITARLEQNFGSGGSAQVITTVFTATGSTDAGFTRYSGTVTLPSVAGKTIGAGNNLTLALRLTAPDAGDYVDVTHVQLEEGSVATPFEQRPIGTELALCQRYAKVMRVSVGFSAAAANSVGSCTVSYAMRAAPTVSAIGTVLATNVANHLYENISETGLRTTVAATAAGDTYSVRDVLLTAEL